MKKAVSILAAMLVLLSLASCASGGTDAVTTDGMQNDAAPMITRAEYSWDFKFFAAASTDIFTGTLLDAKLVDTKLDYAGNVITNIYQIQIRVNEVMRGDLSCGEVTEKIFGVSAESNLKFKKKKNYLLLLTQPGEWDTGSMERVYEIAKNGKLKHFYPKMERPSSNDYLEVFAYSSYLNTIDSMPTTLDQAKEMIKDALSFRGSMVIPQSSYIFTGTLLEANLLDNEGSERYLPVKTYALKMYLDSEELRHKHYPVLSPGEDVEVEVIIGDHITLEEGKRYLILTETDASFSAKWIEYHIFEIAEDGTLLSFYPDEEGDYPKTLAEAKAIIRSLVG